MSFNIEELKKKLFIDQAIEGLKRWTDCYVPL